MNHPNAYVAGGTAASLGAVLWLLSLFGVTLPNPPLEVGVWMGGAAAAVILFIGREGFRGLFTRLWRGSAQG